MINTIYNKKSYVLEVHNHVIEYTVFIMLPLLTGGEIPASHDNVMKLLFYIYCSCYYVIMFVTLLEICIMLLLPIIMFTTMITMFCYNTLLKHYKAFQK
jgi:hypothetical protein